MNNELSTLKVYYGWAKLNKIRRKPALSVIYENERGEVSRREMSIKRTQDTCFVRQQTVGEAADGKKQNRVLTEYSMFLLEKPFKGDIDRLLQVNYQSDINNVPEPILSDIKNALMKQFRSTYYKGFKP